MRWRSSVRLDGLPRTASQGFRIELALAVFVVLNLVLMLEWWSWETLPFHFIFVSVTLVYGIRAWRTRPTLLVIGLVCLATGLATLVAVARGSESSAELLEVPLMTLIFVVMVWHVRSRQEAAHRLEAALERERQFFANASHELLTPLTIARGSVELLGRSEAASAEDVDAMRDVVLQEIDAMERLVGNLLTIGRLSIVGAPDREQVDVEELVGSIAARWRRLDRRRWAVDVSARGSILVDRAPLERAVDNLIENAYVHTYAGDRIAVCCWSDGGELRIAVNDDGAGMDERVAARVFERFYRTDPSRSRRTGGTGLGLAIVQDAVAAHDGLVRLWTAPGEGTCVVLELPGFERRGPDRAPARWAEEVRERAEAARDRHARFAPGAV
jgi:signal transduction histidine kinase